ncbi:unnamed protein product [Calicophoron daubneyi]|uniref:Endoglycoceramidase n=1 Tax=Calicophoron daubneyi TaxID=300641 RepID=A0AAV2T453_CALDB
MGFNVLIPVYLLYAYALHSVHSMDKISLNENGLFTDAKGRVILLHGFNSVAHDRPWFDKQMLNRTRLEMFRNWGINVVRLGMMWTGVMPSRSSVDTEYLTNMGKLVDLLAEYGIYVLLDMHQDQLSSRFDSYDGIPPWLVDDLPPVPHGYEYPWPFSKRPYPYFKDYFTYACTECAEQLYTNATVYRYWGDFWQIVAKNFGRKNSVLGYELINEPPMSNFYKDYRHILAAYVGRNQLLPVYDYLVRRIRMEDSETLIFYEPLTYGVFTPGGTGFDRVPDALTDSLARTKSVLSYHYYCWPIVEANLSKPMPWWVKIACDKLLLPAVMRNTRKTIGRIGGGRFLTEFGYCVPDGNPTSINTMECAAVLSKADEEFQSWTYWDTKCLDEFGNVVTAQVNAFSRVYPVATLGNPIKMHFDQETGDFFYSFLPVHKQNTNATIIAEIFVPKSVHYPDGYSVGVEPSSMQLKADGNMLYIIAPAGTSQNTKTVNIHIRRGKSWEFLWSSLFKPTDVELFSLQTREKKEEVRYNGGNRALHSNLTHSVLKRPMMRLSPAVRRQILFPSETKVDKDEPKSAGLPFSRLLYVPAE